MTLARGLFEKFCRTVLTVYCPLSVSGRELFPDASCLVCSNHCSHMDAAVLMTSSGRAFERFGMVAAMDYFFEHQARSRVLGSLMTLIPVDRHATRDTIRRCLDACRAFTRHGVRYLIIYPEGTRSLTGTMQPFKKGPAMIAFELGLPIVPAYIDGSFQAWPKGKAWMRARRIHVAIGPAIYPGQLGIDNGDQGSRLAAYRRITRELEQRIHQLKEGSPHGTRP